MSGTDTDYALPDDWDSLTYAEREDWAFSDLASDGGRVTLHEQRWRKEMFKAYESTVDGSAAKAEDVAASTTPPFKILTRTDLRAMPRVAWLIDGLVQTSGLVVLAGDGGIGKSAVAIDWAATIASGRDRWHGRRVKAGNVLYVAGEGVEGFEDRLAAWEAQHGVTIPEDTLHFVSEGFSLTSDVAALHMQEAVSSGDYSLIILDTLSQLSGLENENDNAEVGRVLNVARNIRQARPGTTVLILHHVSKGGRVRGASAIRNNADAVIVARADAGTNVATFNLTTEHEHDGKQKNGRAETLDGFWLDSIGVGSGVVVRRGGSDAMGRAIDGVLADRLEHDGNEFYIACVAADDATKKAVRRRLQKLVDDGVAVTSGTARAVRWRLA